MSWIYPLVGPPPRQDWWPYVVPPTRTTTTTLIQGSSAKGCWVVRGSHDGAVLAVFAEGDEGLARRLAMGSESGAECHFLPFGKKIVWSGDRRNAYDSEDEA